MREDQRFGRAFTEIGVADAQLGVRPDRALRVGLGDLLEELARRQPLLLVERLVAALEEELVRLRRARAERCRGRRRPHKPTPIAAATTTAPASVERSVRSRCECFRQPSDTLRPALARARRPVRNRGRRAPATCRRTCGACRPSAPGRPTTLAALARHAADHLEHLVHRDARAASNIVHAARDVPAWPLQPSRPPHRHEREVARLLAVAEDGDRLDR